MSEFFNVVTVASELRLLASKLSRVNTEDFDVTRIRELAGLVEELEQHPGPATCFYAGWQARAKNPDLHIDRSEAYEQWLKDMDAFVCHVDDQAFHAQKLSIPVTEDLAMGLGFKDVSKETLEGFGKLGNFKPGFAGISLVDPDTGDTMEIPESNIVGHAKLKGPALREAMRAPSLDNHTARVMLEERIANLERDLVALRRDMGERIQELSKAPKKWRA